jgi:hypothetical protein
MIPKSGTRFSDKIMLNYNGRDAQKHEGPHGAGLRIW